MVQNPKHASNFERRRVSRRRVEIQSVNQFGKSGKQTNHPPQAPQSTVLATLTIPPQPVETTASAEITKAAGLYLTPNTGQD